MNKQKVRAVFDLLTLYILFIFIFYMAEQSLHAMYDSFIPSFVNYRWWDTWHRHLIVFCTCLLMVFEILSIYKEEIKPALKPTLIRPGFIIRLMILQYAFMLIARISITVNITPVFNSLRFWIGALQGKKVMTYQTIFKVHLSKNVLLIIYTVVLMPIVEELIYRKILYTRLKEILSVKFSAGVTAILYAVSHIKGFTFSLDIVYLLFLGILLIYCYEKTKTIFVPIIFHLTYSIFNYFMNCLKQDIAILLYLIIFIAAFIILIIELIKYLKRREALNGVEGNAVPDVKE